jgi:hypothetical protein
MPVGGTGLIFIPASAGLMCCDWRAVVAHSWQMLDYLHCDWRAGVACYNGGRVPTELIVKVSFHKKCVVAYSKSVTLCVVHMIV